jgi:hypothetical protein
MILRRLTQHVKEQNWFAVGIDFVIVVVGVFIGIQVANWNDLQQERMRAEDYTGRLKSDLRAELEYAEALIDYYETTLAADAVAYAGLMQTQDISEDVILVNAYRAT